MLGSSSASWKPVQTVTPKAAIPTESDAILSKTEEIEESSSGIAIGTLGPIAIHRKRAKGAPDVVRAVCTVPVTDAVNALDSFRAVLTTHSLRDKWDPVVEKQEVLEIVEPAVTLVRTFTKIGWPSRSVPGLLVVFSACSYCHNMQREGHSHSQQIPPRSWQDTDLPFRFLTPQFRERER